MVTEKTGGAPLTLQEMLFEHWLILMAAALCIGMDKGGLKPLTIVGTFLLTTTFGPRMTLAITGPIMFAGDLFPIIFYRDSIDIPAVKHILPAALVGLAVGALTGSALEEETLKSVIGIIILVMAVIVIAKEFKLFRYDAMRRSAFTGLLGSAAGFSSIIGNAAGGFTSIYFLAHERGKRAFIGSSATLVSVLNLSKLLIYIFYWQVVTVSTLGASLIMIPFILTGTALTTLIIRFIPEHVFRFVVIASILYSGFRLLTGG